MAQVLLIEDDPSQRVMAGFALRHAGHEVREAPDGPQGLEAARAARPDVIVSDVMMPGMTGYEVVEAVRADPALANVPVLLLTAMSDRKHMRQGMTAGADDYLTKPYRPAELCEAIDALLDRRRKQQQAFMNSMGDMVSDVLEEQKEALARKYEAQLVREVGARWTQDAGTPDSVVIPHALLLLVDAVGAAGDGTDPAATVALAREAQQKARDTLYLFGASVVLPFGTEMLGVFEGQDATATLRPEERVLRAAFALLKAAPRERGVRLTLHAGPLALLQVHDALHGERTQSLVPGETLDALDALRDTGRAAGWRITASRPVAEALARHLRVHGSQPTARTVEALELRPHAAG